MKLVAMLGLCIVLSPAHGLAQSDGLSLQAGLTLQSRTELEQTIGGARRQSAAVVAGALEGLAASLAGSHEKPAQVNVVAAQLPAEWLPRVNGVTFTRLNWPDAKRAWENDCLRVLWVTAKVEWSALTITVAEGDRCHWRGRHYLFLRAAGGRWSASEGGGAGFGMACHPCRCR